jgi:ATP synthase protein I
LDVNADNEGEQMDEDKKGLLKTLGLVSTMGIAFAVAIAIGVFAGLKMDAWLGTKPWFFFIFLFFGIAAGFRNIFILAGKELRDDGADKNKRG